VLFYKRAFVALMGDGRSSSKQGKSVLQKKKVKQL